MSDHKTFSGKNYQKFSGDNNQKSSYAFRNNYQNYLFNNIKTCLVIRDIADLEGIPCSKCAAEGDYFSTTLSLKRLYLYLMNFFRNRTIIDDVRATQYRKVKTKAWRFPNRLQCMYRLGFQSLTHLSLQ